MKKLFVLYDAKCELCRRVRNWLSNQSAFVPLAFVPLQISDLEERFPGVSALKPETQILAIADSGEVWRGEDAWILCLWALHEYREWSFRLASPALRSLARKVCSFVSGNRHGLSKWLFGMHDAEIAGRISTEPEHCTTACATR